MSKTEFKNPTSIVRKAFIATLPVMAGYMVLGIGFGVILRSKGFASVWAPIMSTFIYAGSMQFAALSLMEQSVSFITIALTTLMVNARHLFYGISVVDKYRVCGGEKPYVIFALTDETYSLTVAENPDLTDRQRRWYYFLVSLFDHIYWIAGSTAGTMLGSVISFNTEGMDFALTALFITIFTDQWRSNPDHIPALTGVLCALVCLVVFGADDFLIPAMLAITAVLLILRKIRQKA